MHRPPTGVTGPPCQPKLASWHYEKEPDHLFCVRVADGCVLAAGLRRQGKERSGVALTYRNTNLLILDENHDVLVGKTGFNSAARWCVATVLKLQGRRIAFVVLGAPTKYIRFRDVRKLADWVGRQLR